jgi:hypothetical protein
MKNAERILRRSVPIILKYLHFAMFWISYQKTWYWIVTSVIEFLQCVMFVGQSVDNEVPLQPIQLLFRFCGDEASVTQPVVWLPSACGSGTNVEDGFKSGPILFMLPGLEGMASSLEPLARNLNYQTVCLQLGYSHLGQTVQDMVQALLPVQITP